MALVAETGEVVSFCPQPLNSSNTSYIANQWLQAFQNGSCFILKELKESGRNIEIGGICISGNGPTVVLKNGRTLLWNDPAALSESAGAPFPRSKSFFLPRIAALRNLYPAEWNASARVFSGPEFAVYKLTGTEITLLPEQRYAEAYWTPESLEEFNISPDLLPEFVLPGSECGTLNAEYAKLTGITKGTPVFCGGPDFVTALIGTNTLKPGRICDRAGSSEGLNMCSDRPYFSENLRTLPSVIPGLWNISYIIPHSGSLFSQFRNEISSLEGREISYEEITQYSVNDKNSEGWRIITELKEKRRKGLMELYSAAEKTGLKTEDCIYITGGQARNKLWLQENADGIKTSIAVSNIADSELIGDAVIGFYSLKKFASLQEAANHIVRTSEIIRPAEKTEKKLKIYSIPEKLKAIIFDIDSTLYTSESYAFEQVDAQIRFWAKKQGISEATARNRISQFRKKWSASHDGKKISLGNAFTYFGVTIEESIQMRRDLLEPANFLKRDENLIQTLLLLKEKYSLICVTNNPVKPAQKTLKALGIDNIIPDIIGLDTCGKSKPAKEPFMLACKMTDARPEECLAVGDRYDMDIALPLELGMGGILVSGVKDVYNLPEILQNHF